jgi:hypothetical protein
MTQRVIPSRGTSPLALALVFMLAIPIVPASVAAQTPLPVLSPIPPTGTPRRVVAVAALQPQGDLAAVLATVVQEFMVQEMRKDPRFAQVLGPDDVAERLREEGGPDPAQCPTDACRVDAATAAGADSIVVGRLIEQGQELSLDLVLYEAAGRALLGRAVHRAPLRDEEALLDALPPVLGGLFAVFDRLPPPSAAAPDVALAPPPGASPFAPAAPAAPDAAPPPPPDAGLDLAAGDPPSADIGLDLSAPDSGLDLAAAPGSSPPPPPPAMVPGAAAPPHPPTGIDFVEPRDRPSFLARHWPTLTAFSLAAAAGASSLGLYLVHRRDAARANDLVTRSLQQEVAAHRVLALDARAGREIAASWALLGVAGAAAVTGTVLAVLRRDDYGGGGDVALGAAPTAHGGAVLWLRWPAP